MLNYYLIDDLNVCLYSLFKLFRSALRPSVGLLISLVGDVCEHNISAGLTVLVLLLRGVTKFALLDRLYGAVHVISFDHTVRVFANFRSIWVHVVLYTNAAAAAQKLRNHIKTLQSENRGEIQILVSYTLSVRVLNDAKACFFDFLDCAVREDTLLLSVRE